MEALAVYLIKSGALIALFYTAYYFLLRKETFFKSNRWYLLLGLVTSVVLPLVTYKKVVWIDPLPRTMNWMNIAYAPTPAEPHGFEINWFLILAVVYAIGMVAFVIGFLLDFYSLRKALKGKIVLQQADFRFVDTSENVAPFSYFNYIVYNSSLYSDSELANIIEHEKVHSNQNHTVDVLFARFFCIVFWFNPFVWLHKKAILQNLEFIADSEATKNIADKKSYQITLLKVTAHENCVDITNHFYQSLIKKRIVMLNKNQSKKWNSWKYFLIVPVLAAFMFYFQVKVIAQEKENPQATEKPQSHERAEVVVDKNTSDAQLKSEAERVKKDHGVTLKFSKVKRNSSGEIVAIKASFKDENGKKGVTQVSGDEPIQPIRFYKNDDGAIGFGTMRDRNNVRIVKLGNNDDAPEAEDSYAFSFDDNDTIAEPPEAPEPPEVGQAPEAPEPPEAPEFEKGHRHVVIQKGSKNGHPVVIINGETIDTDKIIADVGPIIVDGVDVISGEKYDSSRKMKDGAIVIDTKKISREAMEQAKESMKRARPKMEKMRAEMKRQREEMDRDRPERNDQEMKQAREEIEQARDEIQKAKAEIEKTRAEMEKEKAAAKK